MTEVSLEPSSVKEGSYLSRECVLCEGSAPTTVKYSSKVSEADLNQEIFSARRTPDGIHATFVECEGCGMIFANPAIRPEILEQLYLKSTVDYSDLERPIYDSYSPILKKALYRASGRETFLEIGGGSGFMLDFATREGFREAIEVEPSKDAETRFRKKESHRFIRGVFQEGLLKPSSVDLACFFQMLDHVPSPLSFLRSVVKVLKPGGVAVCVTHNTKAVSAKLLGEKSPIYDIEHTYLYHPDNLSSLFTKAGFASVTAEVIPNSYPLAYWVRLFPMPGPLSGLKNALVKGLDMPGIRKVRFPIYAGNFAVIASRPKSV